MFAPVDSPGRCLPLAAGRRAGRRLGRPKAPDARWVGQDPGAIGQACVDVVGNNDAAHSMGA